MKPFHRPVAVAAVLVALGSPGTAAAAGLTVTVEGVRDAEGDIRVALFDAPETFARRGKAAARLVLPAASGTVTAVFPDLPPGTYAVTLYHDADRNGDLNRALGLLPTEGWGASNHGSGLDRPQWERSRFDVPAEGAEVRVRLHY